MYCGDRSIVKTVPTHKVIYCLKCRSWQCEDCAPDRAAQLRALCKHGKPTRFLTLTIRFAEGDNPDEKAQELARAWRLLRARIKKRWKVKRVPFIAVWEATKRGAPHLHIFLRGRYLRQSWISEQMQDLINSPVVSIEKIENKDKAANYVTKYISKGLKQFKNCKRYWRSLDWDLRPKKDESPIEEGAVWTQSGTTAARWVDTLLEIYGGTAVAKRFYWIYWRPDQAGPPPEALASVEQKE